MPRPRLPLTLALIVLTALTSAAVGARTLRQSPPPPPTAFYLLTPTAPPPPPPAASAPPDHDPRFVYSAADVMPKAAGLLQGNGLPGVDGQDGQMRHYLSPQTNQGFNGDGAMPTAYG